MSQEQKNRVEQAESDFPVTPLPSAPTDASAGEQSRQAEESPVAAEPENGTVAPAPASGKKRSKRKTRLVSAEEISPRPSYWPLALAFSLALVLFGVIAGPIVVGVGILLAIVAVGGWILERR